MKKQILSLSLVSFTFTDKFHFHWVVSLSLVSFLSLGSFTFIGLRGVEKGPPFG